ncbi:MAG: putative lipid II flippase FtsW [Patescibacteria group bacterium]|nr:putative lipid II flippase FtsW [Patescibacteria group bacterium]
MSRRLEKEQDYFLIAIIAIIVIFGLVMLSSASSVEGFQKFGDPNHFVKNQLVAFVIGIFFFVIMSRTHYSVWQKFAFPIIIVTLVLLISVFIPGMGAGLLGANRWIKIGPIFFQPSEIAKLTFLIYLATWLDKRGDKIKDFSAGFWPFIIILAIMTTLIMSQPDLGTMTVIGIIALSCYVVAGAPFLHLTLIGLGAGGLLALLIRVAPYRLQRFTVFLNPELDPQGIGYHINQALLAIGSGGLLGLGLGHSRQKFNYLPQASSDSIFAVIAEELGFIFVVILIGLFLIFMFRGFKIAKGAPNNFAKILAAGITAWFTFQAMINIGAMTGILPLTGIPLPFISQGGSSLVVSLAAIGILVNISKYSQESRSFWT